MELSILMIAPALALLLGAARSAVVAHFNVKQMVDEMILYALVIVRRIDLAVHANMPLLFSRWNFN
jgi:hypothetical protein